MKQDIRYQFNSCEDTLHNYAKICPLQNYHHQQKAQTESKESTRQLMTEFNIPEVLWKNRKKDGEKEELLSSRFNR
ncbi:unnamed protein product [Linum trigynum]|uniref:Uncharacterized protein n=1 Tax=Linum trigynum TaxID=586398 RepID=A0AAV2GKF7_9ROSI